ncbi:kinase-like domain-containing protein [Umbelopsis sp. PMI_123]|nr:kinase-like domain-containing protein [Umbelopsis sp. PMI_123]
MPPLTKTPPPHLNGSTDGSTQSNSLDYLIHSYPYLDLEVTSDNLFDGAWNVVSSVFPIWKRNNVKFIQCKDGITNQLVRVVHTLDNVSVLVRAYGKGSELIIDRKQELMNIITLSAQNLCPPLYARFKNGLVYGYIEGAVSTVEDMFDAEKAKMIATKLARWHKVQPLADSDPTNHEDTKLWSTMRKWLNSVPAQYEDPSTQATFENSVDMEYLKHELKTLSAKLGGLKSPIVFSHNDLLYGNVIYSQNQAFFIDYEYGMLAPRGFDIGNHFNEFAGFECNYDNYPNKAFQMQWFEWYLTASQGSQPTEEEKEKLYQEVEHYSLASHLYWGLWALCQAMISDIDFSYMDYAVLRFTEYKKRKLQVIDGSQ